VERSINVVVVGAHTGLPTLVVALTGRGLCTVWRLLSPWRHRQAPIPTGAASV
jgi:hypothetical protein